MLGKKKQVKLKKAVTGRGEGTTKQNKKITS
jgi:hypothetical protein